MHNSDLYRNKHHSPQISSLGFSLLPNANLWNVSLLVSFNFCHSSRSKKAEAIYHFSILLILRLITLLTVISKVIFIFDLNSHPPPILLLDFELTDPGHFHLSD
uniref:Uncharacterized protein n=1 Tax=Micrurus spixii TaxID=129469 RepID=A0A2D4LF98_9SAUR